MMRLYLIVAITFMTGCGALTNFVVGASGNVFSDSIDRGIDTNCNKGQE